MLRLCSALCVLCLLLPAAWAQAPKKEAAATVSGTVTLQGSGLRNVVVMLSLENPSLPLGQRQNQRAKTDADGRFRLTGLAAGQYSIGAIAPGYVTGSDPRLNNLGKTLHVVEGENIENIELQLIRGAVITGRITDANDEPVTDTPIRLLRAMPPGSVSPQVQLPMSLMMSEYSRTDDRGVYRLFGLPAGKYKVSVGVPMQGGGIGSQFSRNFIPETFHPDATSEAEAKVIEIEDGQEASNVDIRIGELKKAYEVSGRLIDSQTKTPLAGVWLMLYSYGPAERSPGMYTGNWRTDSNGEFHITGVRTGKHSIQIEPNRNEALELYSEQMTFEVQDQDVSGLELRAQRGASISGTIVIEGTNDPAILAKRSQIRLSAYAQQSTSAASLPGRSARVNLDGSFRLGGLPPAKMRLNAESLPGLSFLRLELNGALVKDSLIEVRPVEEIRNVRVVYGYGNATLRGQVKIVGSTLPEGIEFRLIYRRTDNTSSSIGSAPVDARGLFVIHGLAGGEYDLRLSANISGPQTPEQNAAYMRFSRITQKAALTNGAETVANILVDLTPEEKKR